MRTIDCIVHEGVVEQVAERSVKISIQKHSACSSCHAQSTCMSFDMSNSEIEIQTIDKSFKTGDKVLLKMQKSLGTRAVLFGYGFPFISFLFSLIIFYRLSGSEILSASGAIGILVLYYFLLKIFNRKINSSFKIDIEKQY